VLVFSAGCGSRPDGITRQFYESMVALDIDAMSEHVCEAERPAFRHGVAFLEQAPNGRGLRLEDFKARTERSDGTSVTMQVDGRLVKEEFGERGEIGLLGMVRLVRDGSRWCITGQRDGFRSIRGTAEDVFALLARRGISADLDVGYPGGDAPDLRTPLAAVTAPLDARVITTASGLRYFEIQTGGGAMPEPAQTVRVEYIMWLEASGKQIDTSLGKEPFEFVLGGGEVIDGFDEGIATMREGGRRRLIVPPKLGYGDDDDIENVPPNSTLAFDVELVEVR
jgi:hypothetical protein